MKAYEEKVLNVLTHIPKGKVVTYGQVAKAASIASARLVGKVLHNNPDPKKFPCHRVVFKNGGLSENFAFGGKSRQMALFKKEGVVFIGEKVAMKKCRFKRAPFQ